MATWWTSVAYDWGSTPAERAMPFPCDRHLSGVTDAYFRAIDVDAPPAVVFRWLCQLKVAPYSYDWIDNFGRTSPRVLTPGLENLEVGQRCMEFFELVEFEQDRHVTVTTKPSALFGQIAVTYLVMPGGGFGSRLVVKLAVRFPPGPVGSLQRLLLPWGDLVMMRRQLLNLKDLAEAQARSRLLHPGGSGGLMAETR